MYISYTEQGRFACFYYNVPCIRLHTYVYLYSAPVKVSYVLYSILYALTFDLIIEAADIFLLLYNNTLNQIA